MYKTEKFKGELISTVTQGKGREFQRKYRCEKGKGGKRRQDNFTAEYRCERKKGGGENYRCERDCECFRRWSYTGGREPLSLFTGEGCILMWHASKVSVRCRF